jgi:hypothetical protein
VQKKKVQEMQAFVADTKHDKVLIDLLKKHNW